VQLDVRYGPRNGFAIFGVRRADPMGEQRTAHRWPGFLADRMVMVVWTPRDGTRHVISMRKCNDREKAI
jgi:uncharacterized DUF497 family protein